MFSFDYMKYLFAALLLCCGMFCKAQPRVLKFRTIYGTVTDQNDHPLTNCTVSFAGISMGGPTDSNGKFKLHFPDEPIMIIVYDRTNNRQYYLLVTPEQQTLTIKLDNATARLSEKNLEDFHKNKEAYTERISQAVQSEEFYEYVNKGQQRGNGDVTIDEPVNAAPQTIDTNRIYTSVETVPVFGNDYSDWAKYVNANLQYPDKAKQDNLQGRVIVSLVVERDGSLTNIKVVRSVSPECDTEAIRLIKNSSKWKPATLQGKNVRCAYMVPVAFGI
jgi:TonB family protein